MVAFILFFPVSILAEETTMTGRLVRMEGDVLFRSSSRADWEPARLQMSVCVGGWLQTKENARAILVFGKEAVVTISEYTLLELKEIISKPDGTFQIRTNLLKGKVWSLVEALKIEKSMFEIETPTAIAGVRGTTFMVKMNPESKSTRVAVIKGEVGVSSRGEKPAYILLKENMATNVVYNEPPTPPEALEAAESAEWDRWQKSIPFSEIGVIGGLAEMHAMQMKEAAKLVRETGIRRRGGKKAFEDFKVFRAALEQYYKDTGDFPNKKEGLKALLNDPGVPGWRGPYLSPDSNLLDPYGHPYQYRLKKSPAKKKVYVEIRSLGLDADRQDDEVGLVFPPRIE